MPKLAATISTIKIDIKKVQNSLHEQFVAVLREAVKVWVMTAQQNIPVWSGASQSTLKTLAGKVGVDIAVFPVPGAPDRTGLGEGSGQGDLRINRGQGRYSFFYSTNLPYLIRNDTRDMSEAMRGRLKTPTPYQFREKADAAFRKIVGGRLGKLPINRILSQAITLKQIRTQ